MVISKKVRKKVEAMVPVKLKEKELEVGLQDVRLDIAHLQEYSKSMQLPPSRKVDSEVMEAFRERALELSKSKDIRQEWYGLMALKLMDEGKQQNAGLAIAMGLLERTAAPAPQGARSYLPSYQQIHDVVAAGIPATPAMMSRFAAEIEVASLAAEAANLSRTYSRRKQPQSRLIVKAAETATQRLREGNVKGAGQLLGMVYVYLDLLDEHKWKAWKGSDKMEAAINAELRGKEGHHQFEMGLSYYRFSKQTEEFRAALELWGGKLAGQKRAVKAALQKVDKLAEKGDIGGVRRLLMLLVMYADSVGKLGVLKKGKIVSLSKKDAGRIRGMERALDAIVKGKKEVDGKDAEKVVFMQSLYASQSAFVEREIPKLEKLAKKMKFGKETVNKGLKEARRRASRKDLSAADLLHYISDYQRYEMMTEKEAARVPDYQQGRKAMLEAIRMEVAAPTAAAHTAAARHFDRATGRIDNVNNMLRDFDYLQALYDGRASFLKGQPKGKIPVGERKLDGTFSSYLKMRAIRLHEKSGRSLPQLRTGATLEQLLKRLRKAAMDGDVNAYNEARVAFFERILAVAGSKLRGRTLTKSALPLMEVEGMLKELEEMYKDLVLSEQQSAFKEEIIELRKIPKKTYYQKERLRFLEDFTAFNDATAKRIGALEKRRVALVEKLRGLMRTTKAFPLKEYTKFLVDVDMERKTTMGYIALSSQLSMNRMYLELMAPVMGTMSSLAGEKLEDCGRGLQRAARALVRGDFKTAEKEYTDAMHDRAVALGIYSAQALDMGGYVETEGVSQYAFYEDMHAGAFHDMLTGRGTEEEHKRVNFMLNAAKLLELSVFSVPADAMAQLPSDFAPDQERVRIRIRDAAEEFKQGFTNEGNVLLGEANQIWEKEMLDTVQRNQTVTSVATFVAGLGLMVVPGGGWVVGTSIFATSAFDHIVTEYAVKGKASPESWVMFGFIIGSMVVGAGGHIIRSVAEYQAGIGGTAYASRLMTVAKTLNYTNYAIGGGFMLYMGYGSIQAFREGRVDDGLLMGGMALFPLALYLGARGYGAIRTRIGRARMRAQLESTLAEVIPFPRPPTPTGPRGGLPRGTWDAAELVAPGSPANMRSTLEGLVVPEKAIAGKSVAAQKAMVKRAAALQRLEMIKTEHPEIAKIIEGLSKDPKIRKYYETIAKEREAGVSRLFEHPAEKALREAEGKIEKMLPSEALKAAEAAEARYLKAAGAEGIEAIGIEIPRRAPEGLARPLEVRAMAKEGRPPTEMKPGVAEPVPTEMAAAPGKEARIPTEAKEVVVKVEAPKKEPGLIRRGVRGVGRGIKWPFKKIGRTIFGRKGEAEAEMLPDMEVLFGKSVVEAGRVKGIKAGELGKALQDTIERFGKEDVAAAQRIVDMLKAISRTAEPLGESAAAARYSEVLVSLYARLRSKMRGTATTSADQELVLFLQKHGLYDGELAGILTRTYENLISATEGSFARFENMMVTLSKEGMPPDEIKLLVDAVAADATTRLAAAEKLRIAEQNFASARGPARKAAEIKLGLARRSFQKVTGIREITPTIIENMMAENQPTIRIANVFGAKVTTPYNSMMPRYLKIRGRVSSEAMERELNLARERVESTVKDMPRAVGRDLVKEMSSGEAAKRKDEIINAMKVLKSLEQELRAYTKQGGDLEKLAFDAFKSENVTAKIKEIYGDKAAKNFKLAFETAREEGKTLKLDGVLKNMREGAPPELGVTIGKLPNELERAIALFAKRATTQEMVRDFRLIEALTQEFGGPIPTTFKEQAAMLMVEDRAIRQRVKKLPAWGWLKATWLMRGIKRITLPRWGLPRYIERVGLAGRKGKLYAIIRWRNSKLMLGQVALWGAEAYGAYKLAPPVWDAIVYVAGGSWDALGELYRYIKYWVTDLNIDEEREKIMEAWGLRSLSDESVEFIHSDRGEDLYNHLRWKFVEAEKRRPKRVETLKKLLDDETLYVDPRKFDYLMGTIGPELDEKLDDINELLLEREIAEDKEKVKKELMKTLSGMDITLTAVDELLKEEKKKELDIGDLYDLSEERLRKSKVLYTHADAIAEAVCVGTGVMTVKEYREGELKPASLKAVEFLAKNHDEFIFLWESWWGRSVPSIYMGDAITSVSTNIKDLRVRAKEKKLETVLEEHLKTRGLYLETAIERDTFLDRLDERAVRKPAFRETFKELLRTYKDNEEALKAFNKFRMTINEDIYGDVMQLAEMIVKNPDKATEMARKERFIASYMLAAVDPSLHSKENIELVRFAVNKSAGEKGAWRRGILRWIEDVERERLEKGAPPRHILDLKKILDDLNKNKQVRRMSPSEVYTQQEKKKPPTGYIMRQLDRYRKERWWKGESVWKMVEKGVVPKMIPRKDVVEKAFMPVYPRIGAERREKAPPVEEKKVVLTVDEAAMQMPEELKDVLVVYLGEEEEKGLMMEENKRVQKILKSVFENDPTKLREYAYNQIWGRCKRVFDMPVTIEQTEKKMEEASGKERTRLKREVEKLNKRLKSESKALKKAGITVTREEGMMKIDFTLSPKTEKGLQKRIEKDLVLAKKRK